MHTIDGTYAALSTTWREAGYTVTSAAFAFTPDSLRSCLVVVIANALAERNRARGDSTDWSLPTPSAFTPSEISAVRQWVTAGGRLLLIADHMPMAGAAADMAAAFDVRFNNGFAMDTARRSGTLTFRRGDATLATHPITEGRSSTERIDSVVTYTGQAFQADGPFRPLLVIPAGIVSLMPAVAWRFTPETKRVPVGGWLQGAAAQWGNGRVLLLGEAALFRPDDNDRRLVGQNGQFAVNVIHWLAGVLDP